MNEIVELKGFLFYLLFFKCFFYWSISPPVWERKCGNLFLRKFINYTLIGTAIYVLWKITYISWVAFLFRYYRGCMIFLEKWIYVDVMCKSYCFRAIDNYSWQFRLITMPIYLYIKLQSYRIKDWLMFEMNSKGSRTVELVKGCFIVCTKPQKLFDKLLSAAYSIYLHCNL